MKLLRRLRAFFRKEKLDADMAEEMRLHLDALMRRNLAAGMSPKEASHTAQRQFGGVEQIKERARAQRGFVWLEQTGQDVRYAARQVRRNPGFAAIAIGILALGIGATTTIFSVVNGIILKPLPYDDPGQLVQVFEVSPVASPGVFLDWREQTTRFEGLAAYQGAAMNLTGAGEPRRLTGLRMSANGLALLRARPVAGRIFAPDEDQPGKDKVVVLSYQLWQRNFGGDPGAIGRTMSLNDERYTIVGVLPDGFLPFATQELIVPLLLDANARENRGFHSVTVLARLRPGVTRETAQAELNVIMARIRPLLPGWKRDWGATIVPLHAQLVGGVKPALLALLAAVGLVLLIACTNVANLLLAKASARQREIAVRAALGASRGRIVRQLLAESALLSVAGAGLGLLLAGWAVAGLRPLLGSMGYARAHEIALDPAVLALALAASALTGIGFGLAPAWQASRPNLTDSLKDAARGSAGVGTRLRSILIIGEVALALLLLVGAGLLLRSFYRLVNVPPGFTADHALTAQLVLSRQKYPDAPRRAAFYQRVTEGVAALPGVEAAGLAGSLPLRGVGDLFFHVTGRAAQPAAGYSSDFDNCTADYFRAMGIPLLRGRIFTASEAASGAHVAVVSAQFAADVFAGEDPIGHRLEENNEAWEIVGVVGDVRMRSLVQRIRPMVFRPQSPAQASFAVTLVVRTRLAPRMLAGDLERAVHAIDPAQPLANVLTLEEVAAASVADRRLTLRLFGGFAGAALLLAAIGLYGVIAYAVTQRTREFGIRLALGATRGEVSRLVLGQSVKLVGVGLGFGLAGALGLARLLGRMLFEIEPADPLTFGGVSVVLLVVALSASWLPARRAAKVDPMVALRSE